MKGCRTCGHIKEHHTGEGTKYKYCGFCKKYIEIDFPDPEW